VAGAASTLNPVGACPAASASRVTPAVARLLDELVRDGASNAVLADRLCVTVETVKWHVSAGMGVSGAANRTALALWWLRVGRYEYRCGGVES
jgi:DNA-binding NarL/FixJ family response regulator